MSSINLDEIAGAVLDFLNQNGKHILEGNLLNSPRTVGDTVEDFLATRCLPAILQKYGIAIKSEFSRRAMEDMAFTDREGNYYAVDVKTHNTGTLFNMPNLISVKKLATFYRNDDKNNFCILIISYDTVGNQLNYTDCHFKRIESFDWDCLTLGALGWGQIQIANANLLKFYQKANRKVWMLTMCDKLSLFYDEEISKIGLRKSWFRTIRDFWESR